MAKKPDKTLNAFFAKPRTPAETAANQTVITDQNTAFENLVTTTVDRLRGATAQQINNELNYLVSNSADMAPLGHLKMKFSEEVRKRLHQNHGKI